MILDNTTLPVSEGTSFFYQPAPESVPTEYADAGVYYSGLQFGWLPDSRGYLAMRLFSYEIGQYYDPDYAITSDFDRCVLDVVNPKGLVIGTLPICPSDVAVNPEMTLLAAPIKLTELDMQFKSTTSLESHWQPSATDTV